MKQKERVLLIGNYRPDRQFSMDAYRRLLESGLQEQNIPFEVCHPAARPGKAPASWSLPGYWDKYLLFPGDLRRRIKLAPPSLVHILDHSNAVYGRSIQKVPWLVTCHDVLAVQAARGVWPQVKIGWRGRLLQSWILRSLRHATAIACVSEYTRQELLHFDPSLESRSRVIYSGLPHAFQPLTPEVSVSRLRPLLFDWSAPYLLHVGSNAWYKNRDGLLLAFQCLLVTHPEDYPDLRLVLAGDPLNREQMRFIEDARLTHRITFLPHPTTHLLEALYSLATLFFFPSHCEGFGWPPLEAQQCGCPVVASSRGSLREILGDSAMTTDPSIPEAMADTLHRVLKDEDKRKSLRASGFENVMRFRRDRMIHGYRKFYRDIADCA